MGYLGAGVRIRQRYALSFKFRQHALGTSGSGPAVLDWPGQRKCKALCVAIADCSVARISSAVSLIADVPKARRVGKDLTRRSDFTDPFGRRQKHVGQSLGLIVHAVDGACQTEPKTSLAHSYWRPQA